MDRNQRRELERTTNNLNTWYKSLSPTKKNFIQYEVEKKVIENDRITNIILDSCYISSIANNTDLELLDIEKIIAETSTYIEDYKNKLEEHRGDVIEMIKAQESSIKSKMRSLIKANKDKVESIKILEKEYKLPFAELDVMWLQVKSKMGIVNKHAPKKAIAEQEIKEVLGETKEPVPVRKEDLEALKELTTELPYVVTPKEIEKNQKESNVGKILANEVMKPITPNNLISASGLADEVKISAFEFKAPSKLKILEQTIKIQGEYGIYVKTSEGVSTEGKTYRDIIELEEERKTTESELQAKEDRIKEEIEELNKDLEKIKRSRFNINGNVKEIKQVFNL